MIAELLAVLDDVTVRDYRAQIRRSVLYALLEGLTVGLTLPVLASIMSSDDAATWRWLGVLAVATAATLIAHAWSVQRGTRATFDAMYAVQKREIEHLETLPLDWFSPSRNAETIGLLWPGAISITRNILLNLGALARGLLTPAVVLLFALAVSWRAALVMTLAAPVLYLTHRVTTRRLEDAESVDHAANTEATARVVEYAQSQLTLRSADRNNLGMSLLTEALDDLDRSASRGVRSEIAARAAFGTMVNVAVAVVVAVVGVELLNDPTDIATLIALSTLSLRFAEPIVTVAATARMLRTSRATITRTVEFLRTPPLPEPAEPQTLPDDDALSVRLNGVDFTYAGAHRATLTGVDLDVPAGSTVAIVGASGAGKSTLLSLIPRFTDPSDGSVVIGGVDARCAESAELRTRVGVIMPEVVLLDGSIRDNVLIGDPDASESDLNRVAAISGLNEIIARVPGGWDAPVGPQGGSLSGGERQRVHIARVALQDPSVVVLDEATAALDPLSERIAQQWVDTLSGRRTVVVVAHRMHTVMNADRVIVLSDGRVVESGSPSDLADGNGPFASMIASRTDTSSWRPKTATEPAAGLS